MARTNLDLKYLPINGLTHTVLSCVLIKTVLFFSPFKLIYIYDGISMEVKHIANLFFNMHTDLSSRILFR